MSETDLPTEQPSASEATWLPPPDGHAGRARRVAVPPTEGSAASVGLIWRVRRRAEFQAFRTARRVHQDPLRVSWVPGDPSEPPRVAYAIGRRVGNAVERNRLRRRLRAILAAEATKVPPGAYLIQTEPATSSLSYQELRTTLMQAIDLFCSSPTPGAIRGSVTGGPGGPGGARTGQGRRL